MNRDDTGTDARRRFGSLCESLRPDLLRFAFWLGRDRQLAEDVVQEAMLRAWKSLDSLTDQGKAKSWLLTIVRREFARSFERKRLEVTDLDALVAAEADVLAAEDEGGLAEMREALFRLEDEYREPLVLQVLMGYTTQEIADAMGMQQGAVLTRLFRARARLRRELGLAGGVGVMIDCLELRRRVGAEPFAADADLEAHLVDCAACTRYRDEVRAMDGVIARALAIDVARLRKSARAGAAQPPQGRRRFYAIAASLVAGLAVGLVLLTVAPRASIAREVVDHVVHEPATMASTVPLSPAALAGVLAPEGARLRPGIGDVTFAARCVHDGHVVPHLVVRMPEGAVTVLVLTHRDVGKPLRIEDQGLIGRVLPAPRGSIAIVGQDLADPDAVARKVFEAVDWGV